MSEILQPLENTISLYGGPVSAATRVCSTPELLSLVLSHLDRNELPPSALVCRFWLDIARDHIWREVLDVRQLFGLLAPLKHSNSAGFDFERTPSHADWVRFRPLASRVQIVKFPRQNPSSALTSVLSKIAFTKLWHPLLPNLRKIVWLQDSHLEQLSLFLHPGLHILVLYVPPPIVDGYSVEAICDDIASKAPSIQKLYLHHRVCRSFGRISIPIANLVLRLGSSLRVLSLPVYGLTQSIFEAAGQLQNLTEINFSQPYPGREVVAHHQDVLVFRPQLNLNSQTFSSLCRLFISAPLVALTNIITSPNFPSKQLSRLFVRAMQFESRETVASFHAHVARTCANLVIFMHVLSTPYNADGRTLLWDAPDASEALCWDVFAPLAALKKLHNLTIVHDYPLTVTASQLANLVRNFPALNKLVFNPAPRVTASQTIAMKLADLGILVDAMPRVLVLELCMDATENEEAYIQWTGKPFALLKELWLSASPPNTDSRMGISVHLARLMSHARLTTRTWNLCDYRAPATGQFREWDTIARDVAFLQKTLANGR